MSRSRRNIIIGSGALLLLFITYKIQNNPQDNYEKYFKTKPTQGDVVLNSHYVSHYSLFGFSEGHEAFFTMEITEVKLRSWIEGKPNIDWERAQALPEYHQISLLNHAPPWFLEDIKQSHQVYFLKDECFGYFVNGRRVSLFDIKTQ
jgi:hypothetical protein